MRVVWTRVALGHLAGIADYVAEHDTDAADRLIGEIHGRTADLLSENPRIGRPGRLPNTRELYLSGTRYIVGYRVGPDAVEVLAVIHAARRWPERL